MALSHRRYFFLVTHLLNTYIKIYGHNWIFKLPCMNFNLHHVSTKQNVVGARTVEKLIEHDFRFVQRFQPRIIIFEIGTNDLSMARPKAVGSKIDDLVALLQTVPMVKVIGFVWSPFEPAGLSLTRRLPVLISILMWCLTTYLMYFAGCTKVSESAYYFTVLERRGSFHLLSRIHPVS